MIKKLRRRKGMQKLLIAGLGLAFLGFIVGSFGREFFFIAGIIFVGIIILGVIGIMKLRRSGGA